MNKATITFEDDGEELKMSIDFEGGVNDESMAHLAAAAVYVEATKKLNEVENADATKA